VPRLRGCLAGRHGPASGRGSRNLLPIGIDRLTACEHGMEPQVALWFVLW